MKPAAKCPPWREMRRLKQANEQLRKKLDERDGQFRELADRKAENLQTAKNLIIYAYGRISRAMEELKEAFEELEKLAKPEGPPANT